MTYEIDQPCQRCSSGRAYRTIGTVAMCHACANKVLDPIRKRVGRMLPLRFAVAIGNGYVQCQWCGASWVGSVDDQCDWCVRRHARMDDDEIKDALWPPWALNGVEGPRYDALDDAGKEVWRKTRDQRTDEDSYTMWVHKLSGLVKQGRITQEMATSAIRRFTQ